MATLRFGIGVRDITPLYPVMLHGYASRDRLSGERPEDRVSEPVSASALALEASGSAGGRTRVAIVALDMIGVHAAEIVMLRTAIARATGLRDHEILIAGSHSHFAPCISTQHLYPPELGVLDPDPRFVAEVTQRVVEAVTQAFSSLETGTLESYRVAVPSVLFNRRAVTRASGARPAVETNFLYPEKPELYSFSPVDPELSAIRLTTASGPKAVLANFGCHPVTGGADGPRSQFCISSDYPFYLRETVTRAWGCPVLFTLGAAGDAVPLKRTGTSRQEIGGTLGNALLMGERVFAASGRRGQGEAALSSRIFEMEAKTIVSTRGKDVERSYQEARRKLLGMPQPQSGPQSPEREAAVRDFLTKARLAYRARLYPEDRFTIQVQLIRVGELVLVCLPFEVLSEVSLRLKAAFSQTVLVSIANGYEGYLPFAYEYDRGGYEATPESTHFERSTADRLVERILQELKSF